MNTKFVHTSEPINPGRHELDQFLENSSKYGLVSRIGLAHVSIFYKNWTGTHNKLMDSFPEIGLWHPVKLTKFLIYEMKLTVRPSKLNFIVFLTHFIVWILLSIWHIVNNVFSIWVLFALHILWSSIKIVSPSFCQIKNSPRRTHREKLCRKLFYLLSHVLMHSVHQRRSEIYLWIDLQLMRTLRVRY